MSSRPTHDAAVRASGSDSVFGTDDSSSPALPAVLRRDLMSSASRTDQLDSRFRGVDVSEVIDVTGTGEPLGSHSSFQRRHARPMGCKR